MKYRPIRPDEYELLKDFLYEAIYIPEGAEVPDRSIIEQPELALYYRDFGSGTADHCIVAEQDGHIVGAVWTRIMDDYGHIDDDTPSLAISVLKKYRGQGIGAGMLRDMLTLLKEKGYKRVSLSVQKANFAVSMYEHAGFRTIAGKDDEYLMVCELI